MNFNVCKMFHQIWGQKIWHIWFIFLIKLISSRTCCRTDSERVLYQTVSTVPFTLVGSDEAKVRVLGPLEASGLQMEITHEKFHQATYGFTDMLGQYLSGEKPKGQLETEEMLKVRHYFLRYQLDIMHILSSHDISAYFSLLIYAIFNICKRF